MMINWYPIARSLMFCLDAEEAHHLALTQLRALASSGLLKFVLDESIDDPIELMGLTLLNRVGLAAGLDKNAAHIDALGGIGFGFIEVGTVTPLAQAGNPKPRMFRLTEHKALINRLGFNNDGLDAFLRHVKARRWQGPIGLNIGKNAATAIEDADQDYLRCLEAVHPYADYITVNISSPNTKNLRQLQSSQALETLLSRLRERCDALDKIKGSKVPMVLKIAPDLDTDQIDVIAALLLKFSIDGVIVLIRRLHEIGSMVRLMQMKQAVCLAHPYSKRQILSFQNSEVRLVQDFQSSVWAEFSVLTMPWQRSKPVLTSSKFTLA